MIISKYSGLEDFSAFDMIYLPASWASSNGDPDSILIQAESYKQYVENGGGLVVEQPNPHKYNNGMINVTLLPVAVTFTSGYNQNDFPARIADTTHYLTKGLTSFDMPFPADQVVNLDTTYYHLLAFGKYTKTPSLFVKEYGSGKILVQTSTLTNGNGYKLSDTLAVRMINWLTPNANALPDVQNEMPQQFDLYQNYPNPFNADTRISYFLKINSAVELIIYNILGKKVNHVILGNQNAGQHSLRVKADAWPSGIYYYELRTNLGSKFKNMMLLK